MIYYKCDSKPNISKGVIFMFISPNVIPDEVEKTTKLDMFSMVSKKVKPEKGNKVIENFVPFKEYQEEAAKHPTPPEQVYDLNLYKTPNNFEYVQEVLTDYDNLSDAQFMSIFRENYSLILSKIIEDPVKYNNLLRLFTNPKTLILICNVFNSGIVLSNDDRIHVNKLVYDYTVLKERVEYSEDIERIMMKLCHIVNRDLVPQVQALGIPEDLAIRICTWVNSSKKERINILRLNILIMNQSAELMTDRMITDIYNVVLRGSSMTKILEGILFDVWDQEDIDTEDKEEIYANTNLALLNLLEDLPSDILKASLDNFVYQRTYVYPEMKIRFNIRSFVETDYPRLANNMKWIDSIEGYRHYC